MHTSSRTVAVAEGGEAPRRGAGLAPVCSDAAMVRVFALAAKVAPWRLSVMITGETGVGKEVVARTIHRLSPRAAKPLLIVNCAALSPTLFESELFGHEKGAFTGAVAAKPGFLQACQGGTLFLDEVGELPLVGQSKLLRALESREVIPVGATGPRSIDVRFIAATNRNLEEEVAAGRFRADLFHRLNGLAILVPPLRERPGEIPELARLFLEELAAKGGRPEPGLSEGARAVLQAHRWPGNVRELRATIERAIILCDGGEITEEHLLLGTPELSAAAPPGVPERDRIMRALDLFAGNQTRAARSLGIPRRTFVSRLDQFRICRPRKTGGAHPASGTG